MLAFPQFPTGSGAQYPVIKRRQGRTVVNEARGGSQWKHGDFGAWRVEWELDLRGLSEAEAASVKALFDACEGRYGTFCYLDPTANLLSRSEDLTAPEWVKDPLVQVTAAVSDPWGTARAARLTNAGQTTQALWQTLLVPAQYAYTFSVWLRAPGALTARLFERSEGGEVSRELILGSAWSRQECRGRPGGPEDSVEFGLEIPAGGVVDAVGFQVEAQPGVSVYMRTAGAGGVYPSARFQDDVLSVTAEGPEAMRLKVRIGSPLQLGG